MGLRALMNIEVMATGPDISMPGCLSSSGTGGTCQSVVVAGPGARCAGCRPSRVGSGLGHGESVRPQLLDAIIELIVKRDHVL
jgi:hypothetical protein